MSLSREELVERIKYMLEITPEAVDLIPELENIDIEELDKETHLQIFDLNYADPTEIQTKLIQLIPKTEGDIMVDIRTKSIIVKALPNIQKEVETLIKR